MNIIDLTITLTGRAPVTIDTTEWPIVAHAEHENFDTEHKCQANKHARWTIIVRQHADGRAIVYGVHSYTNWRGASSTDRNIRGGELLDGDQLAPGTFFTPGPTAGQAVRVIPEAVFRVACELEARMPPEDFGYSKGVFPRLAHECIADLPAVKI